VFALLCWVAWYLSPHHIALLEFDRQAIAAGEWWRLWSAHLIPFNYSQLLLNSGILALMGFLLARFTKSWQLLMSLLIAMPMMTGLLLLLIPDLKEYRGAIGVAAMMLIMAIWFLIIESKRFSLGYWIGVLMLFLFVAKLGLETWMIVLPTHSHVKQPHVLWLVQCFGVLLGLAFFNALHQAYSTRAGKHKHYRGATVKREHDHVR